MQQLPAWNEIERDVRIGVVLVADACRYMLGMGKRGDAAAAALLGIKRVPGNHLDDRIGDKGFLKSINIEGTAFADSARRCYDLVTVLGPIEEIDIESERTEGTYWLSYFLSFMPSEAMGGQDFTGTFHHPDSPLPFLRDAARARLELAEYIQGIVRTGNTDFGFTPRTISVLGDVNIRTVRNALGPKGDKPIRSKPLLEGSRSDLVLGDPLDAIEWLSGRRGFHPGRLTPDWINSQLPGIANITAAAALPGLTTWLNRTTTKDLAKRLGWPVDRVRAWTRGEIVKPDSAQVIAEASGLDGKAYSDLIRRFAN